MKQTVIITGGTEGIGKAIAKLLVDNWNVVIVSRDADKGEAAARELGCQFLAANVADYAAVERVAVRVAQEHGRIDAIVNNAGLWIQGPIDENDPSRMRDVILSNTLGALNGCRAVVPIMKRAGRGAIINISSSAGLVTKPDMATYDASKWGVTGASRALQQELAPFGIRVTAIYPGKVETKLFESAGNRKDFADALQAEDVARAVKYVLDQPPAVCIPDLSIRHL